MLEQLLIRNFALIEEMCIPFHEGLTVLSGETGAGKSIVVDAVTLVLGAKGDKDMVRRGSEKAYVEGVFSVCGNDKALAFLHEQKLLDDDGSVIIAREINLSGRSTCRVNGVLVGLSMLKMLSSLLMEIHGQHEHQALLADENHITFLDMLGDAGHAFLVAETSEKYTRCQEIRRELEKTTKESEFRQERLERLNSQKREIEKADLKDGEEDDLVSARDMLRNADKIDHALRASYSAINEADGTSFSALALVKESLKSLREIEKLSDHYGALFARLESLYYELEDIGLTLRDDLQKVDLNGVELEKTEVRLDLIRRLEKKYGVTIADILVKLDAIDEEIRHFESIEDHIHELRTLLSKAWDDYEGSAKRLTASRCKLAHAIEEKMNHEFAQLNMQSANFLIQIESDSDHASSNGFDRVRFMIAANKGEDAKLLSKTASGGELSRIMLGIKSVAAEKTMVPSMVFDEIDTGISGRTAQVVAEKMWFIARYRQVICVTHLQQIAAMASSHALVSKQEMGERTITQITYLDKAARTVEISRMLGETSEKLSGINHAESLLEDAAAFRAKHPFAASV